MRQLKLVVVNLNMNVKAYSRTLATHTQNTKWVLQKSEKWCHAATSTKNKLRL